MKPDSTRANWPYPMIVVCLFMLSVTAPRVWCPMPRRARSESLPGSVELQPLAVPPQLASIARPIADQLIASSTPASMPAKTRSPLWEREPEQSSTAVELPPPKQQPVTRSPWPKPVALIEQLEVLSADPMCCNWAREVLAQLDQLAHVESLASPEAEAILPELRRLATHCNVLTDDTQAAAVQSHLLRAGYAICRRLDLWDQVHRIALRTELNESPGSPDPTELVRRVGAFHAPAHSRLRAGQWKSYLLLDQLRAAARAESGRNVQHRRKLARQVLARMESHRLSRVQRKCLQEGPFAGLSEQLRHWATQPVDYEGLLRDVERFEKTGSTEDAQLVAEHCRALRWSADKAPVKLAHHLDTHWRNANIRATASGTLLNRLLPEVKPEEGDVDDDILGADVCGRSLTSTRLFLRLLPDQRQLRLGLEASGKVSSETASFKGVVTTYNEAISKYMARKLLLIGENGVRVWDAIAEADNSSDLLDLSTDLDPVPLLGFVVRSIAWSQVDQHQRAADFEVEEKVAARARQRLDQEANQRIQRVENEFRTKVLSPLNQLGLDPTAVDLRTTHERIIARYRLAGTRQLAAHTPRPRAPQGNFMSVQIHQSAVNNLIEQLDLDGKKYGLRELYRQLTKKLGQDDVQIPKNLPDRVRIQFADTEAVRIRCDAGRVELTIKVAQLAENHGNRWRNFTVRAYYHPDPSHVAARLARHESIQLIGQQIGLRDQVALRGIFSKVLSRNRQINILPSQFGRDPRLQDQEVIQFIIEDGWIGIALGTQRQSGQRVAVGVDERKEEIGRMKVEG